MIIVFATANENKVREIRAILPASIEIRSLADIGYTTDIPETSDTIEGNSMQKARYLKEGTGMDCFAEDTGLEVEALDGAPGVLSARYGGPAKSADDNMDLLLKNMEGKSNRKAQFKTVITLIVGTNTMQFEGTLTGTIGFERRGHQGFGYDPVFVLPDGRSLAELSPTEKAEISHRARATKQLVEFLQKHYI